MLASNKWWHERVVYQIYPKSFKDSNGDGIGDLPGIISSLDAIQSLGIGIIWLSPIYASPNADNGYDISDYRAVHPDYGTFADLMLLIKEAHARDIKVVMDLVINHTSDEHEWFKASRDPESPYRDYYYWRKNTDGKKPNNWTSFFAEDCWVYDSQSDSYYLHLFHEKQPDLNYHNPKVLEEVKDIMRFWLDNGIDGFRCDVINIIYKSSLDNGKKKMILTGSEHYLSQEGAHEILRSIREDVLDHYDCFAVGETVFVDVEAGKLLTDPSRNELDMIFSFEHMETDQFLVKWFRHKFTPYKFMKTLDKWQNGLNWTANYFENHDQTRSVSRFGDDDKYWSASAKMLCTLLMSLKGTPYIYQGQEIGMTNFDYETLDDVKDVESHNVYKLAQKLHIPKAIRWRMIKKTSRDNARTPYQWNFDHQAGFTTGTPWIAVNKNHKRINYAAQASNPKSILSYYKKAIHIRNQDEVLIYGDFKLIYAKNTHFVIKRTLNDQVYHVLINFGMKPFVYPLSGNIILSTHGRKDFDGNLSAYEAIIIES